MLLLLMLLTIDLSKTGFSKLKGSAGKTPSIPDEILWRLSAFQILLIIVFLKETLHGVIKRVSVEIDEWDVQACHRFKEKERTIVKVVNRKDYLQIFKVKKEIKSLDMTEWDFH